VTSQKLVVLSGLPGSGKNTLAEGLSRILSLPVFSVDPIEAAMWRGGLGSNRHRGL
jgi:predicted kinase